jgi:hypothetical protein
MAGRKSGFYFPSPRPTYGKNSSTATTTVTVMYTFKDEFWKEGNDEELTFCTFLNSVKYTQTTIYS